MDKKITDETIYGYETEDYEIDLDEELAKQYKAQCEAERIVIKEEKSTKSKLSMIGYAIAFASIIILICTGIDLKLHNNIGGN